MMVLPMVSLMPAVRAMWAALTEAAGGAPPGVAPIDAIPDLLAALGLQDFIALQERYMPKGQY